VRSGGPLVNLSLIDTDIWIDILRGKNTMVKEKADTYWRQHGVFIWLHGKSSSAFGQQHR
jgi:hypothetical protein